MQVQSDRRLLLIILSVLAVVCLLFGLVIWLFQGGLSSLSAERGKQGTSTAFAALPTITAHAQATAAVESTVQAVAPTMAARMNWPSVLIDTFDTSAGEWSVGSVSSSLITGEQTIADGRYRWTMNALKSVRRWEVAKAHPVSSLYLTVEGELKSGDADSAYGLLFHYLDSDNFYSLIVGRHGYLRLDLDYRGQQETIFGWSKFPAVRETGVNKLTVTSEGTHYIIAVNDQYITAFEDKRLPQGQSGVIIDIPYAGQKGVFEFRNFILRAPDGKN